jgi:hypothetical protein
MKKVYKRKTETSKLILRYLLLLVLATSFLDFLFTFNYPESSDSNVLVTLTECVYAMTTIAVSFYYWKAKNENLHKYKRDDKIGDN